MSRLPGTVGACAGVGAAVAVLLALTAGQAGAQVVKTYTETFTGGDSRPLGYPVPLPIASLEPVDGFRDYASLHARLQSLAFASDDLSAHEVGTTEQYQRTVWAYRVGDADDSDVEGAPEAAFFINAGTHAREWGTQEISTALIERMVEGAGDGAIVRYLLDNTRLVIIPVHNVDGFLQTQRYPTQVIIGKDPTDAATWPRDGRMRRKNMRGADEVLETFADHLRGIDLNRNHPPKFGGGGSSGDPDNLVYRGSAPHSEAENLALLQALLLAPPERLRLGVDVHSFAQVFYSSNTGRNRLNNVQGFLLDRIARHHRVASRRADGSGGASYNVVPDPPNSGMGVAAEYFAYEYLVPAWTLEIEPRNGGRQYGGTAESHGGFILPAAEVRRVRDAWAESHLVAFYFMAGAPHLAEVRVVDSASGALVQAQRWQRDGDTRTRVSSADGALLPGRRYRAELVFNKPMRVPGSNGAPSGFPGLGVTARPLLELAGPGGTAAIDALAGSWQAAGQRYAHDTFTVEFDAPAVTGDYTLRVQATDAVGLALDADPRTPVDWVQGAWSGLENEAGTSGDSGGIDAGTQLSVASAEVVIEQAPAVLAEGGTATLVVRRLAAGASVLSARVRVADGDAAPPACEGSSPVQVQWAAGEAGVRSIGTCVADDLDAQGTRSATLLVETAAADGVFSTIASVPVSLLDNDSAATAVVRARGGAGFGHALALVAERSAARAVDIVLDGGGEQLLGTPSGCGAQLSGPATVFGNHARVRPAAAAGDCTLLRIGGPGAVELRDLELDGQPPAGAGVQRLVATDTALALRRVELRDAGDGAAAAAGRLLQASAAPLTLERVLLAGSGRSGGSALHIAANATLETIGSAALQAEVLFDLGAGTSTTLAASTLRSNGSGAAVLATATGAHATLAGNVLQESAGAGPLCRGGDSISAGYNIAADSSCATTAVGDHAPLTLPASAVDVASGIAFPVGAALDAGGACPGVDLRGAPRPQAAQAGAEPRCDAGALEAGVNPYRGLWIPDRPGHGVDIHSAGNTLFLTWYTYNPDGSPAAYQAAAPLTGPRWRARLDSAHRTVDGRIEVSQVGEIELEFASDIAATLRWRLGDATSWSSEGLSAYFFADGEPRMETTGVWFVPDEPGYGVTVTRRGELTGVVLYYYDSDGVLRWALGQGGAGDILDVPLLGFSGFCPDCDAQANPPQSTPVGTLRMQFLTPVRARMWVDAGSGAGARFVREDVALVPINDPVDNRRATAAGDQAHPAR